jgi:hypothetical protein
MWNTDRQISPSHVSLDISLKNLYAEYCMQRLWHLLLTRRQARLLIPMFSISQARFDMIGQKWCVYPLSQTVLGDNVEQIHINSTFNVCRLIGLEAAKRKVKAYVRAQPPLYISSDKGSHDEKEDVKPVGSIGIWWHESLRALAAIDESEFCFTVTRFDCL